MMRARLDRRHATAALAGALLLSGCADPYPTGPYFAELNNAQRSLSDGVLTWAQADAWTTWDAERTSNIQGIEMGGIWIICKGTTLQRRLPYVIERGAKDMTIRFGEDITCTAPIDRMGDEVELQLNPVIRPLPSLFDPDEPVGVESFVITLHPRIG